MNVFLALALLVACSAVQATVQVVNLDLRQGDCTTTKTSIPFMLGNKCFTYAHSDAMTKSLLFDCNNNAYEVFNNANCTQPFATSTTLNCVEEIGYSVGFSCKGVNKNDILLFRRGNACNGNNVDQVSYSSVLVLNTCTALPDFGGFTNEFYMITTNGTMVNFQLFNVNTCSNTPIATATATINGCGELRFGGGSGRRLSIQAAAFATLGNDSVNMKLNVFIASIVIMAVSFFVA